MPSDPILNSDVNKNFHQIIVEMLNSQVRSNRAERIYNIGTMLTVIRKYEVYRSFDCPSFRQFVRRKLPFTFACACDYMRLVNALTLSQLEELGVQRGLLLLRCPVPARKELLRLAPEMPLKELENRVRKIRMRSGLRPGPRSREAHEAPACT